MLLSRGPRVLGAVQTLLKAAPQGRQIVRGSHGTWSYRKLGPPPDRRNIIIAETIQGFAWWWILWHLWTEPGHVFGEFEYPNPREWTDEELGIPAEVEVE